MCNWEGQEGGVPVLHRRTIKSSRLKEVSASRLFYIKSWEVVSKF